MRAGGAEVRQSRSQTQTLIVGGVLTLIVVANRLLTPVDLMYDSQSRSDLLAVAAIAVLVLSSLSSLDVTARAADPVVLDGVSGRGLSPLLLTGGPYEGAAPTIAWAAGALLENTPAATFVFAWKGRVLHREGVIPQQGGGGGQASRVADGNDEQLPLGKGPIATRAVGEEGGTVYLPALQSLPGRTEFTRTAVPSNAQSLVVVVVGEDGLLMLAGDTARAFTPKDLDAAYIVMKSVLLAMTSEDGEGRGARAS